MPTPDLTPAQEKLLRSLRTFCGARVWAKNKPTLRCLARFRLVDQLGSMEGVWIVNEDGRRWIAERDAESTAP